MGVLVSSGFIIGQDVATLHSSRESNQLRNSNRSEYVEEKAEQGDLIICTINYCVPEIFWNPANLSSQSGASCLSWLFLDHDLGVQPSPFGVHRCPFSCPLGHYLCPRMWGSQGGWPLYWADVAINIPPHKNLPWSRTAKELQKNCTLQEFIDFAFCRLMQSWRSESWFHIEVW